jgi:5-methylcytosine-specific restriction protein B
LQVDDQAGAATVVAAAPRPVVDVADPILTQAQRLLDDGYGGIVFRGPPGTSKTWYAEGIADRIVGGVSERIRFVQFHSSYQYEDFVEGFVPDDYGNFVREPKHLLLMCEQAREHPDQAYVLVVDELSRADPSRVFGEALTYIEGSKRGQEFQLASGTRFSIPPNLVILATMNEFDRGVQQVDEALERRLAFVAMEPDPELLRDILNENEVDEAAEQLLVSFFERNLLRHPNRFCRIGHAYFRTVRDSASLRRLWDHQLKFVLERAFSLGEPAEFEALEERWSQVVADYEALERATTPSVSTSDGTASSS